MAVSNVELRVGATQAITALKNVNTQAQKFNQTVNGTNSKLKDANRALPILGKGFFNLWETNVFIIESFRVL